jgi:hypothetical protein
MAGISIPAAPGFGGWTRLKDGAWKTMLPSDVAEVRAALEADTKDCPSCNTPGNPVKHGTTYISEHRDTHVVSAHSYRCRSGSRWFDPSVRAMVGRAHCTCDACF